MSNGLTILNDILIMIPYIFFPPFIVFFISEVLRYEIRFRKAIYIVSFIIGIIVAMISAFFPMEIFGDIIAHSEVPRRLGDLILVIIISKCMIQKRWKRFLTALFARDILVYLQGILSAIGFLLTGVDIVSADVKKDMTLAALDVLWLALEFLMFFFIGRMRKKKDDTPLPLFMIFILFTIITIFANLLPISWDVQDRIIGNRLLYLIFMVSALAFVVIMFYVLTSRKERKDLLELNSMREELIRSEARYFEAAAGLDDRIRALKHDMKNNVAILSLLLKNGEYEKMRDYLEEMGEAIDTADVSAHTGNTIADVIIAEKREKAKEAGAALKVSGQITDVDFSPMDTCKIIANILDNAIEAVSEERIKDIDESFKIITLDFKRTNHFFMISLKNPCADKPDLTEDSLCTTKKDAKNHGFGLKNVREAAAVYSGEVSLDCTETPYGYEFVTELLFPVNV